MRPALAAFVPALALVLVAASEPPAHGGRYAHEAVATDHALASGAAAAILARGGSAADAAAAAMLVLGVVNPISSGFGGGGFALYYDAATGTPTFLDFRERAPAAATADMFEVAERAAPGSQPSLVGGLAVGVPGEPAGIEALVRRFGRLPLAEVVRPAVNLATRGVAPSPFLVEATDAPLAADLARDRVLARWTRRGAIDARSRLVWPALASVLRTFGRRGSRAIYEGAFARRFARDVRAHGGILTEQDLRDYRVVERSPLREAHFGRTFLTAPPPSAGGATLLASLDLLERRGLGPASDDVAVAHALAESWKGPFLDRQEAFGDPDYVDVPIELLLSADRRARRAAIFDPSRARAAADYAIPLPPSGRGHTPDGGGTSHLCVVDRDGNVASVTTTVNNYFGARFTAAGVLVNDEMDDFARAVGVTNVYGLVGGARNLPGPGRRPVSSMSPTIVLDAAGRPELCIGASGGSRIPTATTQVAFAILVRGIDPVAAIALPRVHHQAVPDVLRTETRIPAPAPLLTALAARGHTLGTLERVADVQLIAILPDGRRIAASDPRKGGRPSGR